MSQAGSAFTTTLSIRTSDTPSAYAISSTAWIPTIEHSGRTRTERFPKKVKPSAPVATAYAAKVVAWRAHRAAYKRRKIEAIAHPRYFAEAAE